jgi:DNA-binding MarR family transcriptional regulator
MTIEQQILKDLSIGRSTASAIAQRIKLSEGATTVILKRLEKTNHVETRPLGHLLVYQLKS